MPLNDEYSLNDLLAALDKSQLIPVQISIGGKDSLTDLAALQSIIKHAKAKHTTATLKDYVLERAKRPSQPLKDILTCLKYKNILFINKKDLLINLIAAHQKGECTVYDIGAILMQYTTIAWYFKTFDPAKSQLEFIAESALPGFEAKNKSRHAQINKTIKITGQKEPGTEQLQWLYPIVNYFSTGDFCSNEPDVIIIPSLIQMAAHLQANADKKYTILPGPILGCYDYAILRDMLHGENRTAHYWPMTLATFLPPVIRSRFYGASDNDGDAIYNNRDGFKEMVKAHGMVVGFLEISMHDLGHCVIQQNMPFNRKALAVLEQISTESTIDPATMRYAILNVLEFGVMKIIYDFLKSNKYQDILIARILKALDDPEFEKLKQQYIHYRISSTEADKLAELRQKKFSARLEF